MSLLRGKVIQLLRPPISGFHTLLTTTQSIVALINFSR